MAKQTPIVLSVQLVIDKFVKGLQQAAKAAASFSDALSKMNQAGQRAPGFIGPLQASLSDIQKAFKDLKKAADDSVFGKGASLAKTGAEYLDKALTNMEKLVKSVINTFETLGRTVEFAGFSLGLVGFQLSKLAELILTPLERLRDVGTEFEASVDRIVALQTDFNPDVQISPENVQAATEAYKELEETIVRVAEVTKFTSTDVAKGAQFLALAGLSAEEIINNLKGVVDLAAAGNLDLAKASDIATDSMLAFGLQTQELTRVIDAMAVAQARSNTSIIQLANAYKFAAPPAAALGLTIEETTAAIGVISNAGIKASVAGTSFGNFLNALARRSTHLNDVLHELGLTYSDINLEVNSLDDVLRKFLDSNITLEQQIRAFNRRGARFFSAFAEQGANAFSDLRTQIEETPFTALDVAAVQIDNVWGALKILESQVEALSITFFDLFKADFRSIVRRIGDVIVQINEWFRSMKDAEGQLNPTIKKIKAFVLQIGKAGATALVAGKGFQAVAGIISGVGLSVSSLSTFFGQLSTLFFAALRPLTLFKTAVSGAIAALVAASFGSVALGVRLLTDSFRSLYDVLAELWTVALAVGQVFFRQFQESLKATLEASGDVVEGFRVKILNFLDALKSGGLDTGIQAIGDAVGKLVGNFLNFSATVGTNALNAIEKFLQSIRDGEDIFQALPIEFQRIITWAGAISDHLDALIKVFKNLARAIAALRLLLIALAPVLTALAWGSVISGLKRIWQLAELVVPSLKGLTGWFKRLGGLLARDYAKGGLAKALRRLLLIGDKLSASLAGKLWKALTLVGRGALVAGKAVVAAVGALGAVGTTAVVASVAAVAGVWYTLATNARVAREEAELAAKGEVTKNFLNARFALEDAVEHLREFNEETAITVNELGRLAKRFASLSTGVSKFFAGVLSGKETKELEGSFNRILEIAESLKKKGVDVGDIRDSSLLTVAENSVDALNDQLAKVDAELASSKDKLKEAAAERSKALQVDPNIDSTAYDKEIENLRQELRDLESKREVIFSSLNSIQPIVNRQAELIKDYNDATEQLARDPGSKNLQEAVERAKVALQEYKAQVEGLTVGEIEVAVFVAARVEPGNFDTIKTDLEDALKNATERSITIEFDLEVGKINELKRQLNELILTDPTDFAGVEALQNKISRAEADLASAKIFAEGKEVIDALQENENDINEFARDVVNRYQEAQDALEKEGISTPFGPLIDKVEEDLKRGQDITKSVETLDKEVQRWFAFMQTTAGGAANPLINSLGENNDEFVEQLQYAANALKVFREYQDKQFELESQRIEETEEERNEKNRKAARERIETQREAFDQQKEIERLEIEASGDRIKMLEFEHEKEIREAKRHFQDLRDANKISDAEQRRAVTAATLTADRKFADAVAQAQDTGTKASSQRKATEESLLDTFKDQIKTLQDMYIIILATEQLQLRREKHAAQAGRRAINVQEKARKIQMDIARLQAEGKNVSPEMIRRLRIAELNAQIFTNVANQRNVDAFGENSFAAPPQLHAGQVTAQTPAAWMLDLIAELKAHGINTVGAIKDNTEKIVAAIEVLGRKFPAIDPVAAANLANRAGALAAPGFPSQLLAGAVPATNRLGGVSGGNVTSTGPRVETINVNVQAGAGKEDIAREVVNQLRMLFKNKPGAKNSAGPARGNP